MSARARYTARTAQRYELYEEAVQTPEADAHFVDRVYRAQHGRPPRLLREDFCGTGLMAATWVRRHRENHALGIDLDPVPLAWGTKRHAEPLGDARSRLELVRADVRTVRPARRSDVVVALNFSYYCFRTEDVLVDYFSSVRRGLRPGGMLVLDAFGGPEAMIELEETRRKHGFTYVWEQEDFDPISHELRTHITFRFPDGTQLRRAFSYEWRLWTLPELRRALAEAGYRTVRFYFETIGRSGRGTGIFRETRRAEPCEAFVCCIVAS